MIKSRAVFAASAVFLSIGLAAGCFLRPTDAVVRPSNVLTWDCEIPAYKPESIMIYCGDGGAYIDKITWKAWSSDGATGTGEYYRNLCKPDCADGKMVHAPVLVRLSNSTPRNKKFYLRTLDMTSTSGKDFPWGEFGELKWNVMEFVDSS